MDNQAGKARKNISGYIPLVLISIGLVIIGFVAIKLISDNGRTSEFTVTPALVNYPAPDLTLEDLYGEMVSLSDYYQQVLLVNNWATWCPPCKLEMPTLAKYFEEHRDQGFMLIGIEVGEPKDQVVNFVQEYDLTFLILLDPSNKSMTAFQNDNLPSSYVIDRNGNVVLAWTGPISHSMLEKFVTPLLEQ